MRQEGRNKVGRSPVSRHNMQSYIPTCYRLRKREPLIAMSSHQMGEGGGLNFCIRSTTPQEPLTKQQTERQMYITRTGWTSVNFSDWNCCASLEEVDRVGVSIYFGCFPRPWGDLCRWLGYTPSISKLYINGCIPDTRRGVRHKVCTTVIQKISLFERKKERKEKRKKHFQMFQ